MKHLFALCLYLLLFPGAFALAADERSCTALVVMSYHDDYAWQHDLKRGIQAGLTKDCELVFTSLDTLRTPEHVAEKAKLAHELLHSLKPDAIIAADDPAQIHFVVPYLKQNPTIPVVFCGINANLSDYGYPTPHITGVLERYHIAQSLAFLKKAVPAARSIGFVIGSHNVSGKATIAQIRGDIGTPPIKITGFETPATLEEALRAVETLARTSDALYLEHFEGMADANGVRYSQDDVMKKLTRIIPRTPVVCGNDYSIEAGCMLAVMKTGFEQGNLAAKRVRLIHEGAEVSELPVIRNNEGIRIINLNAMKRLGINPPVDALRGVKLMREN